MPRLRWASSSICCQASLQSFLFLLPAAFSPQDRQASRLRPPPWIWDGIGWDGMCLLRSQRYCVRAWAAGVTRSARNHNHLMIANRASQASQASQASSSSRTNAIAERSSLSPARSHAFACLPRLRSLLVTSGRRLSSHWPTPRMRMRMYTRTQDIHRCLAANRATMAGS